MKFNTYKTNPEALFEEPKSLFQFNNLFWILLLCMILSSCTNQTKSEKENAFSRLFPDVLFNKYFKLTIVQNDINQKTGPFIFLGMENLSSSTIVFPTEDAGIQIIAYSEGQKQWQELNNNINYICETVPNLYPKKQGPLRFMYETIAPEIEETGKEIIIRIVVIGTVYEDAKATDKLVGAYTDLTLSP